MKLRIQGNLMRLRLTQQEVARLRDHKLVECAIRFQSGRAFSYLLASSPDAYPHPLTAVKNGPAA